MTATNTTTRLTLAQAKWAEQHDWFVSYQRRGAGYQVQVCDPGAGHSVETFSDFQELRAWAGY